MMQKRNKSIKVLFSSQSTRLTILIWILRLVGILGFILSVVWFLSTWSFEPIISILASISAFIASFKAQLEKSSDLASQHGAYQNDDIKRGPPRRVDSFVERYDAEGVNYVQHICERFSSDPRSRVVVWGEGGIGKTTIASEVVQRLYPNPFAGGIYWISIDGSSKFGLGVLVDVLLVSLDHAVMRELSLDLRKAELRSELAKIRCLVVLDSFETVEVDEQAAILDFVKDASGAWLITSRLKLPYGYNLHLSHMTPGEAGQFLAAKVRASGLRFSKRLCLNDIARIADHNPLLMEWIISQYEVAASPQTMLDELSLGTGEAADRVFGRSFGLLDTVGQTLVISLALFASDPTLEHVLAISGIENRHINETIRKPVQLGLVELDQEKGIVRLTDLSRRLVQSRLEGEQRVSDLRRTFSVHFLTFVQQHKHPTLADLNALEHELGNLLNAMDYASIEGDWATHKQLLIALADKKGLLYVRSYWDWAIKYCTMALDRAQQVEDSAAAAQFAYIIALYYLPRGEHLAAEKALVAAKVIQEKMADHLGLAWTLEWLGRLAYHRGNCRQATEFCTKSLALARSWGEKSLIADNLQTLGWVARDQRDSATAWAMFEEGLLIRRATNDLFAIPASLRALGRVQMDLGHLDKARLYLEESLSIFRDMGSKSGIGWALYELARLELTNDQLLIADRIFRDAESSFRQIGDYNGLAWTLHKIGVVQMQFGHQELAQRSLLESLTYFQKLTENRGTSWVLLALGTLDSQIGELKRARDRLDQSLAGFQSFGDERGIMQASTEIQRLDKNEATVPESDYTVVHEDTSSEGMDLDVEPGLDQS